MWDNMFDLDLSILEKVLRPVFIYVFLIIGLRLAGKRELAQLNAMDLVVLLMIANTVQNSIIGNDNTVIGGIIGAITLLVINYGFVRFLFSHPKFDQLVEGEPVCLMDHGELKRDKMQRELVTKSELEIAAHKQGFGSLDQVEKAVLESSGVISFVGKDPPVSEARHGELTKRLDEILAELTDVRKALAAKEA